MHITSLNTTSDSLELIGGKGRSLSRMARAGFSVPDGFLVTADAYRKFVSDNNLQPEILEKAKPGLKDGYPVFDACSDKISALILGKPMAAGMHEEIKAAYSALSSGDCPVAVRSSANAEDLPDFSFAGQQETFLNVRGANQVAEAVRKCWASLWTAQAISYRHQNGIDQDSVAMAVVVQVMVPSEVSGILFTANPASGERSEMIINASFGLGEAVVGGQVTPDTFVVDHNSLEVKESLLGPKEQQIVADGKQGVRLEEVAVANRGNSSMSDSMLRKLTESALEVEKLYDGVPQDIEWAFCADKLHLLQSRPITNLPVQPIEVVWEPTPPAVYVSRRQIVENMPDPICPLFEELYLTRGLESPRKKGLGMHGGGPMFVTVNGYGYQRFDWPQLHDYMEDLRAQGEQGTVSEEEIEAMEHAVWGPEQEKMIAGLTDQATGDIDPFRASLSAEEKETFDVWRSGENQGIDSLVTLPKIGHQTYLAFNHSKWNDSELTNWFENCKPRLERVAKKWRKLDIKKASETELLSGICEMGIEEGHYWSSGSSHTFGVAKSTDDQLNVFLQETLPEHNFISGQFLSGIESKTMQSNADLFEIAKIIRADEDLCYTVLVVPAPFLMQALRDHRKGSETVVAIDQYLKRYGHQGYSMDFIEPTQVEDPSALFASLKAMVRDKNYHPDNQSKKTAAIREQKMKEITEILSGLDYWQFRFRLWLARKYNFIREEVAFLFGYTWSILRPMAFELGGRLVEANIFHQPDDIFFLKSHEITDAIEARKQNAAHTRFADLAKERRELREARKRHHPPGTLPPMASNIDGVSFKETQINNDENSDTMRGFAVSSGSITAKASVVLGPSEFDKMVPGSILVSPLTTPAWTQLFAHAAGLVTDVGSILAHGSIVAREYGIPAVLGVGNGTTRIKHGQLITIDGDSGTVAIHDSEEEA